MRKLLALICCFLAWGGLSYAQPSIQVAEKLYDGSHYHEAIATCDTLIAERSYRAEAWLIRGKSNLQLGIFTYAINDFTEALRFDRNQAEAYALRAYSYFRLKEYRLARYDLIEATTLDTSNALYFYNLGDIEHHMHKLNEAIKSYSNAIRFNPYYIEAYKNRGHLYLGKQEFGAAIQDFDSALKYNQNSPELMLYRGMALVPLKRFKEALSMFDRCIRLKPDNPAAYYNRGRVRYEVRDYKGAIADFDTAITKDPQMEIAWFNRALAKMEADKKNKFSSCDDFNEAARLGYTEALFYLKKYCE